MLIFPEDRNQRALDCFIRSTTAEEATKKDAVIDVGAIEAKWKALGEKERMGWYSQSEEVGSPLDWFKVNLSNTCASALGYASLNYISFPVHILAKSSKLIPVMAMGVLINKKKHSIGEYFAVLAITAGIIIFSFGKGGKGGDEHGATGLGLVLVFLNLCCDGFTNATQDQINQKYSLPYLKMMLYMNAPSCVILILFLFNPFSGSGFAAIQYLQENPSLIQDILCFSLMGSLGQNFIFFTIKEFGSLTCQTITLTRKAVQILLSVVLFGHVISKVQWIGCGIVFFGLMFSMYSKNALKKKLGKDWNSD